MIYLLLIIIIFLLGGAPILLALLGIAVLWVIAAFVMEALK